MNPDQIDRFFKIVAGLVSGKVTVILTGASAAALMGRVRPSIDIDFAIKPARRSANAWDELDAAVRRAAQLTGIHTNYAEDIDRWGLITLLDYERHTRLYKKFSRLEIRVLEPAYWSIGKMTRYLDPDVRDMAAVFKKQKVRPKALAALWGKALRRSPRSAALSQFRRQVEDFFVSQGKSIWGKNFSAEKAIQDFHISAGIR